MKTKIQALIGAVLWCITIAVLCYIFCMVTPAQRSAECEFQYQQMEETK